MSTSKHLIRQCVFVLIIPLLLISTWYGIAYTEQGLQLSLRILSAFVPGHLHYAEVHGTWTDDLHFSKLSYRSPNRAYHLNVDTLTLSGEFLKLGSPLQAKVAWRDLQVRFAKQTPWVNPQGELSLSGIPTDFTLQTEGNWQHAKYPTSHLALTLQHTKQNWIVSHLKITSQPASVIEATGSVHPLFDLHWHIKQFSLAPFIPSATGLLTGTGTLAGTSHHPTLKTTLTIEHVKTHYNTQTFSSPKLTLNAHITPQQHFEFNLQSQHIRYNELDLPSALTLSASGHWNKKGLHSVFKLNSDTHTQIHLEVDLPRYQGNTLPTKTQTLQGNLTAEVAHLSDWPMHWDIVDDLQGHAKAQFRLSGTLIAPRLTGNAQLSEGHLSLPTLGVQFNRVTLHLKTIDPSTFKLTGQAFSGKEILHLSGTLTGFPLTPKAELTLTGSHILTVHTERLTLYTSPHLNLEWIPHYLKTSGKVLIPEARIGSAQAAEINLSSDVQFMQKKTKKKKAESAREKTTTSSLRMEHDLQLTLGNKVLLQDQGLSAQISGQLHIKASKDHLTTASGELLLHDGKYQAYGQELIISQGALHFAGGAINNPGLNIRAQRSMTVTTHALNHTHSHRILSTPTQFDHTTTELTLGLNITGTAEQPHLQLFSEPNGLSQNDILSYLLLGRSAEQASTADNQYLWQAASALGTGNSGLGHTLKKSLKIDDLSIESTLATNNDNRNTVPQPTPTLVLGKHLNKRLYLSYQIGLLQPLNTLRLLYKFSQKWSLQGETGDQESAIDLYYTIEKD